MPRATASLDIIGHFFIALNNGQIYGHLSVPVGAPATNFDGCSSGTGGRFCIPPFATPNMESISVSNPSSPLLAMTTAAVKVLLSLLSSLTVDCCLAAAALVCVILWMISETFANPAAGASILWVLHFAAMSAIDINKKGGGLA